MTEPIRIPLVFGISDRQATTDKDALATNVFYDKQKNGQIFATKRPGVSTYISGSGQAQGIYSYGGEVFTFEPTDPNYVGTPFNLTGITYANSKFLVMGHNNTNHFSFLSTNGVDWDKYNTGVALTGDGCRTIAWNGSTYCAAGDVGIFLLSSDGVTWSSTSAPTSHIYAVTQKNGTFLAIRNNASVSTAYTSTDGVSWISRALPGSIITRFCIGVCGSNFVIIPKDSATFYYSSDGSTWNSGTLPVTFASFRFIANNGTETLISSNTDQTTNYMLRSTDGITWTQVQVTTTPEFRYGPSWNTSQWIFSGSPDAYKSNNGGITLQNTSGSFPTPIDTAGVYGVGAGGNNVSVFINEEYAGYRIARTANNGNSWTNFTFPRQ